MSEGTQYSLSLSLPLFPCFHFSVSFSSLASCRPPPPPPYLSREKLGIRANFFSPSPPPSLFSFHFRNCCQPASAPNCHLLELSVEQSQRAVRCDAELCRLRSTACGKSAGWRRKIKRNREQGSAAIGVCKRRGGRERESEEGGRERGKKPAAVGLILLTLCLWSY